MSFEAFLWDHERTISSSPKKSMPSFATQDRHANSITPGETARRNWRASFPVLPVLRTRFQGKWGCSKWSWCVLSARCIFPGASRPDGDPMYPQIWFTGEWHRLIEALGVMFDYWRTLSRFSSLLGDWKCCYSLAVFLQINTHMSGHTQVVVGWDWKYMY